MSYDLRTIMAQLPDEVQPSYIATIRLATAGKLRVRDCYQAPGYGPWVYHVGGHEIDERWIPPDLRPWRPFGETPRFQNGKMLAPDESPIPGMEMLPGEQFLANSHYLVHRTPLPDNECVHLSMRTVENDARHDWREMQRVKNELCGEHWEGVELYPDVRRIVDAANQFHLWCFPYRLPIGFANTAPAVVAHDDPHRVGVQRPLPEDIQPSTTTAEWIGLLKNGEDL